MTRVQFGRAAVAMTGVALLAAVAVAPVTAQDPLPFTGVNVNLLTFNGPQVAEPLQRRAPAFEALTGAHINVIAVAFQDIYDKAFLDVSLGVNSFDAYVFNPQWLGDFAGPGYLDDLTPRIAADPAIEWDDIGPFFRDFSATYQGKTYTIPLDGDFHMVYYRKDLIETPPATWDDYLAIAEQFNGQDLNEDGEPDFGSCIAKKAKEQSFWWIISIAAGLLQSQGTGQGAFFDTATLDPLFNNEAFSLALQTYKKTMAFGPPNEINLNVGDTRGLFKTGRCALSMDWGDIGTLVLGTYTADKTGAVITPGWTQTWDRAAGALVACDATTCPNTVDGVNHAPFASFGGWSGAINAAAPANRKDAAYAFLSYMTAPAQSNEDVTIGASGYNPYRISQFENDDLWLAAGMSQELADSYLGAIGASLQSPNMILDLRIPKSVQYEQTVLDVQVASYIAGEQDEATTMQNITDGWNAITDEVGRDAQIAAYSATLGVER